MHWLLARRLVFFSKLCFVPYCTVPAGCLLNRTEFVTVKLEAGGAETGRKLCVLVSPPKSM